jgi:Tol biopolymer transport system component
VATDGAQGDRRSERASISADGRYVAFDSESSNLVVGDTNSRSDVFVHDRTTGVTERVSVASDGTQGDSGSFSPSISADGRYVAFESLASNLVAGDSNAASDVFVHDRTTGVTERVSVASDGTPPNGSSQAPSISGNGSIVAFRSAASNLVPGDTNNATDVFVHDRTTGVIERVSVASDGAQTNSGSFSPSVSGDGRYVAFESLASRVVPGDTNSAMDVFVHDRTTGVTERVSVASDGTQGDSRSDRASISADGRHVAFRSDASNLVVGDTNSRGDVFVHDRTTGVTERVSVASDGAQANGRSDRTSMSADGRYVTFDSLASNLAAGDTNNTTDVFVHDRTTGVTERVSVASDGAQANNGSFSPSVSGDGRHVAFESFASNLVPGDTNSIGDVFVRLQVGGGTTDLIPPELAGVPDDTTVPATGPRGATVGYPLPTATDDIDPDPTVVCAPAPDSLFAAGVTTVTCTATDASGNSASASFAVTVLGPAEQLDELSGFVAGRGPGNSLAATVRAAQKAVARGRSAPACTQLQALINLSMAQRGKRHLPMVDADRIIQDAGRIREVLGC